MAICDIERELDAHILKQTKCSTSVVTCLLLPQSKKIINYKIKESVQMSFLSGLAA